jgi:hypothetical protein
MSLNINLPHDLEHAVRERALAAGLDIDTFATRIFSEKLQEDIPKPSISSSDDFSEWLDSWIKLHPRVEHEVDVSRESIYEGCGE